MLSRCAASCDLESNRCLCGSRARYPRRQMNLCEWRGIEKALEWKDPGWAHYRITEPWRLWGSPNSTPPDLAAALGPAELHRMWATAPPHSATRAYCDIDEAALARGVAPLFSCGCYEDATGAACEQPVRSVCLNQCNAPQGVCVRGWCRCAAGFGGADCSIALPALAAPREVDGGSSAAGGAGEGRGRLRPSVFVYDLPSEFNSWTAETRMTASDCVYRRYKEGNETVWENYAFGLELALHEALLVSPHRTLNPRDADFFFVPVHGGCYISRFTRPTPRHNLYVKPRGGAPILGNAHYRAALDWVRSRHPWWNVSGGADHMFAFPHDEGSCVAPIELRPAILISSWGRTELGPRNSTTTMGEHNWYNRRTLPLMYASYRCFEPGKDIVMPVFTSLSQLATSPYVAEGMPRGGAAARPAPKRRLLFHFRGQILRYVPTYSFGIRQQLLGLYGCKTGKEIANPKDLVGVPWCGPDVVVSDRHTTNYLDEMANATFCGVFPGNGWGHIESPLLLGCIPVVVQDGILTAWEDVLDFDSFALRLPRAKLPRLAEELRAVPPERVAALQAGGRRVWERFTFSSLGLAEKRRMCGGTHFTAAADGCVPRLGAPGGKHSQAFLASSAITGQDAIATLLQLLRARLLERTSPERG